MIYCLIFKIMTFLDIITCSFMRKDFFLIFPMVLTNSLSTMCKSIIWVHDCTFTFSSRSSGLVKHCMKQINLVMFNQYFRIQVNNMTAAIKDLKIKKQILKNRILSILFHIMLFNETTVLNIYRYLLLDIIQRCSQYWQQNSILKFKRSYLRIITFYHLLFV